MGLNIQGLTGNKAPQNITGRNLYIGKGSLILKDQFIALDAISTLKIVREDDITYGKLWYVLGGALLATVIGISAGSVILIILGIIVTLGAGLLIYDVWKRNNNKGYNIDIKLNNGERFMYGCNEYNVACDISDAIIECINNRHGGYKVVNKQVTKIDDHSVGKITIGGNNSGDMTVNGESIGRDKKSIMANDDSEVTVSEDNGLTDSDWRELEKYLLKRQSIIGDNQKDNDNCEELIEHAHSKDEKGFINTCKKMGKESVNKIFQDTAQGIASKVIKKFLLVKLGINL